MTNEGQIPLQTLAKPELTKEKRVRHSDALNRHRHIRGKPFPVRRATKTLVENHSLQTRHWADAVPLLSGSPSRATICGAYGLYSHAKTAGSNSEQETSGIGFYLMKLSASNGSHWKERGRKQCFISDTVPDFDCRNWGNHENVGQNNWCIGLDLNLWPPKDMRHTFSNNTYSAVTNEMDAIWWLANSSESSWLKDFAQRNAEPYNCLIIFMWKPVRHRTGRAHKSRHLHRTHTV